MIKYIEENVSLSLEDRKALYKDGDELFKQVEKEGGFLEVFSKRVLPDYLKDKKSVDIYKTQLIIYEYSQKVDASLLSSPYYLTHENITKFQNQDSLSWLQYPVCIQSINSHSMKMIDNLFSLNVLASQHGEEIVSVEQSQNIKQMKLKLIEDQKISSISFSWPPNHQKIKYLLSFLFKSLKPQSIFDGLSYLKNDADLKVKVQIRYHEDWKQGNLTNIGVNEIHFNHGPNTISWIIVERENVNKLRSFVKDTQNIDIFKDKWFENPKFFLLNNIPFKYFQQEKGDLLILNAGTHCWLKVNGTLITTSWCQMAMNDESIIIMRERYTQLKELNIQPSIPYQNLLLDLYIHEKSFQQLESIQKELQKFFVDENLLFNNLVNQQTQLGNRNVSFCMVCGKEIFNYYVQKDKEIQCIGCFQNQTEIRDVSLFSKYRYHCLYFLLQSESNQCDQEFCSIYSGKNKCKISKEQKEQEFNQNSATKRFDEEEQKNQYDRTKVKTRNQTLVSNLKKQKLS